MYISRNNITSRNLHLRKIDLLYTGWTIIRDICENKFCETATGFIRELHVHVYAPREPLYSIYVHVASRMYSTFCSALGGGAVLSRTLSLVNSFVNPT